MEPVWGQPEWERLEKKTGDAVLRFGHSALTRSARAVLRRYSTSFFLVTRFLPSAKRADVEIIYAGVRYPDEIVDTFAVSQEAKHSLLDAWTSDYESGLACKSLAEALTSGCAPLAAGFAQLIRSREIPDEYYRAFLRAMRSDINPRLYSTLDDLIESYVYGSAIVVGYFLGYVYGARNPGAWGAVLNSARSLAIALQLTNFLRDIADDRRRGRIYLPQDFLAAEGLDANFALGDSSQSAALHRVVRRLSAVADDYYGRAESDLGAFAVDTQSAIKACIDVYRSLNLRIGASQGGVLHRQTVPVREKFAALPPSKYWRIPLAYASAI